ncbi:MAG: hypothetical protein Q7V62_16030, partial [Actinomycetota bacterium]|nr:hypothetical protein [Actinomycetota bacterium]
MASTAPLLTTLPSSVLTDCADITTVPASTFTRLRFSTSVSMVALSTCTSTSRSPVMPSVTASPAANATVPMRAAITPSLRTSGASSAAYFATIEPWFTTDPVE